MHSNRSALCTAFSHIMSSCTIRKSRIRPPGGTTLSATPSAKMASTTPEQYPRLLHPGGFALPPLVEDLIPIATTATTFFATASSSDDDINNDNTKNKILRTNLLLIKPPDPESLWEWYAYTKRQSDSDPSWGRVWPTALSLARMMIRSMMEVDDDGSRIRDGDAMNGKEEQMLEEAVCALKTASHIVELGCGLGVAGLAFASAVESNSKGDLTDDQLTDDSAGPRNVFPRTVTFLDRDPYALHCVMASASTNGWATAPISPPKSEGVEVAVESNPNVAKIPTITVRAAIDDWTIPKNEGNVENESPIKNMCYNDLHLDALPNLKYENENTLVIASDILYEPSSMDSLATKLQSLLPSNGGYALIADPEKERTSGCRKSFVKAVEVLGGEVAILPMLQPFNGMDNGSGGGGMNMNLMMMQSGMKYPMIIESDVDIDGNLAKTVLIVVHIRGKGAE